VGECGGGVFLGVRLCGGSGISRAGKVGRFLSSGWSCSGAFSSRAGVLAGRGVVGGLGCGVSSAFSWTVLVSGGDLFGEGEPGAVVGDSRSRGERGVGPCF